MDDPSWLERLLGSGDHFRLGWWTLPLFVGVGLIGALLAGTLALVYYGQQVNNLREETREARQQFENSIDEIDRVRQEALAEIERRVREIRRNISALPAGDATRQGIVAVRATVGSVRPARAEAPTDQPTDQPSDQPTDQPTEEQTRGPQVRVGSGFAVEAQEGTVFYATSYELLSDPTAPGGVTEDVEIVTSSGTSDAEVHSWDERNDLALLRANVGNSQVLTWREQGQQLASGDEIVALGVTPELNTLQVGGAVSYETGELVVVDLPRIDFLVGGPVLDRHGRVVGVFTPNYRPFGTATGSRQGLAPVHLFCERILQNCARLSQPPEDQ